MAPRVLITDTNRWPAGPRLAIGLAELGCEVVGLCPFPGHPFTKTSVVRNILRYDGRHPVASLRGAINSTRPDVILPLCDRGVQHMQQLYALSRRPTGEDAGIADLIERSLGSPASFEVVSRRYRLLQAARSEGILVPTMARVGRCDALDALFDQISLPWIIKADGTSGGRGIRIVRTRDEARRVVSELSKPFDCIELAKRLLLNQDRDWILADWKRVCRDLLVQVYIEGRPANCAVACWGGEVLAGSSFEVIAAQGSKGPASMVRVIENQTMMDAARKIVRRLGLSGFLGFDFMIENGTRAAYLIEMNPRCTTPVPISLGEGRDLIAALCSRLAAQPVSDRSPATTKDLITYFPKNWGVADGSNVLITEDTYYDVPQGEPALVQDLLCPWIPRSPLGRLLDALRKRLAHESLPRTHMFEAMPSLNSSSEMAEMSPLAESDCWHGESHAAEISASVPPSWS